MRRGPAPVTSEGDRNLCHTANAACSVRSCTYPVRRSPENCNRHRRRRCLPWCGKHGNRRTIDRVGLANSRHLFRILRRSCSYSERCTDLASTMRLSRGTRSENLSDSRNRSGTRRTSRPARRLSNADCSDRWSLRSNLNPECIRSSGRRCRNPPVSSARLPASTRIPSLSGCDFSAAARSLVVPTLHRRPFLPTLHRRQPGPMNRAAPPFLRTPTGGVERLTELKPTVATSPESI